MPSALVAHSVAQSALLGAQIAGLQQPQHQAEPNLLVNALLSQQNVAAPMATSFRVRFLVDEGDAIAVRTAFWLEIPLLGKVIAARLADRLEEIADRIEAAKLRPDLFGEWANVPDRPSV